MKKFLLSPGKPDEVNRKSCCRFVPGDVTYVLWLGEVFEQGRVAEVFGMQGIPGDAQTPEPMDNLQQWVSRNWYDVVGSEDVRHFRAGTRVEQLRTIKGAFAYAAKRYIGKKEAMPELEHKPGRFWGVINRQCLKLGERLRCEVTEKQAVQLRRFVRRYRWANTPPEKRRWLFKGGLFEKEFSVKLYCNVDYWLERLPRLLDNFSCNFSQPQVLYQQAVINRLGIESAATYKRGKRSIEAETVQSELHFPQNHHPLHQDMGVPCSAKGDNFNHYV
jgi:hypothetical protein